MRRGAAELLERDLLAGDGLHDLGAGDEHVRGLLDHQHEVGHRGRVDGAARAGPHDQADLRDDPGGLDVAPEDLRVPTQGDDALLDARAARVVDPDQRAAVLEREVHDLADLLREGLRERPSEHREVLGEDEDLAAEHGPVPGHHRVAPRPALHHPEVRVAVADVAVELDEAARVEEPLEPLPGEQLAALALTRHRALVAGVGGLVLERPSCSSFSAVVERGVASRRSPVVAMAGAYSQVGRSQARPASASGRRAHAKRSEYQPSRGTSVVPRDEECAIQPPPR